MKLVIQIPCFNEEDTLAEVLEDLPTSIPGVESIVPLVIDDGSADATSEVAQRHGARVVRHRGNRGLAQAFLTGLETSLDLGADVIVNTDGDHQYPGDNIPALVKPIVDGEADLVIGNRDPTRDPKVPAKKKLFYSLGRYVVRSVAGVTVGDAPSGFRAMSRDFAMDVYLTNPFSYTIETIFTAAEHKHPVREVPIRTNPAKRKSRLFGSLVEYMRRSAGIIVRAYSMHNPMRAFGWLSLPFLLLGTGLGVRFLYFWAQNPEDSGHIQSLILASIAIVVGAQVLIFGMLGDLVRSNRLLLQDVRLRVRRMELSERGTGRGKPPRTADVPHGAERIRSSGP